MKSYKQEVYHVPARGSRSRAENLSCFEHVYTTLRAGVDMKIRNRIQWEIRDQVGRG